MTDLVQAVLAASQREDVHQQVHALYADLQQQIDQRKPLCSMSGRCCSFKEYGHRLYVTTLELAAFIRDRKKSNDAHLAPGLAPGVRGVDREEHAGQAPRLNGRITDSRTAGVCPFQINKLCSVHAIRPFGCRIFFCDPTATQWQQAQYELFHSRLKKMHEELDVPYFYVEWLSALEQLV